MMRIDSAWMNCMIRMTHMMIQYICGGSIEVKKRTIMIIVRTVAEMIESHLIFYHIIREKISASTSQLTSIIRTTN